MDENLNASSSGLIIEALLKLCLVVVFPLLLISCNTVKQKSSINNYSATFHVQQKSYEGDLIVMDKTKEYFLEVQNDGFKQHWSKIYELRYGEAKSQMIYDTLVQINTTIDSNFAITKIDNYEEIHSWVKEVVDYKIEKAHPERREKMRDLAYGLSLDSLAIVNKNCQDIQALNLALLYMFNDDHHIFSFGNETKIGEQITFRSTFENLSLDSTNAFAQILKLSDVRFTVNNSTTEFTITKNWKERQLVHVRQKMSFGFSDSLQVYQIRDFTPH